MKGLLRPAVSAMEIAGSLCGVPFVGAAAVVVREIAEGCEDVRVYKRKARRMANKCAVLLNTLNEQTPTLVGTELQERVDELTAVYEQIQVRVRRWARYNSVLAYVKGNEIKQSIELCESELDDALKLFQVAAIIVNNNQLEAREAQRKDTEELRGLIYQVLANRGGELSQVSDLEREGQHVAQAIMLGGQQELATLRESPRDADEVLLDNVRSSSPTPLPSDSQRYLEYQRGILQKGLIELHQLTGIPPSVKVLNGEVVKVGDLAVAGGTYSDIWQGVWLGEKKVALKALRNIKANDPKARKRFEHEVNVWAALHHDYILPFYGIVTDQGQHIQMVSPWQDNGNVLEYVKNTPTANRIHLLSGAAKGLEYLHSCDIIHGNMKCANILVSSTGEACICDFGMSKIIEEVTEKSASATLSASGSARWLAPELIEGTMTSPTKEADTYSFSMAILELLTGKPPYSNRRRDASVIHDIVILKKIPMRPTEPEVLPWLSDTLWTLMTECWNVPASIRPSMAQVSVRIEQIDTGAALIEQDSDAMDIT